MESGDRKIIHSQTATSSNVSNASKPLEKRKKSWEELKETREERIEEGRR